MNSMSRNQAPARSAARDPVPGGDRRIRRHGVDLTNAAGGQHDRSGMHRTDASTSALPKHMQCHAGNCRPLVGANLGRNEVENQSMLDDLDRAIGGDRGDQRPFDLGAGSVAPGVCDPVPLVAALTCQFQLAGQVAIKFSASVDEFGNLVWPLGDQYAYCLLDAEPSTSHQSVVNVLFDRVAFSLNPGNPTLGPVRRAGRDLILRDDHDCSEIPALQSSRETCDARSDHDDIHFAYPSRRFRSEPVRQRG